MLVSGILFLLVMLPFTFIQFFYAPWLEAQNKSRVPRTLPSEVTRHVLITCWDPIAIALVGRLRQYGHDYVILVPEVQQALDLVDQGFRVLVGELDDATTYLRAQLLPEPARTESLDLLRTYTDLAVELAGRAPGSDAFDAASAGMEQLHRELWRVAGEAIAAEPEASAPKLYVETLNDTIDRHTDRVTSLRNRVPGTVMVIEVVGSAVALGVLALHLSLLGRGTATSLVAAVFVTLLLFVSFDLDRPQRGFIRVPRVALEEARAAMDDPPAAAP